LHLIIEKGNREKPGLLPYLLRDPIRNGFAVEDVRSPPRDGEIFVSTDSDSGAIQGYLTNHYEGNEVFSLLQGENNEAISGLIPNLPRDPSFASFLNTDPSWVRMVRDHYVSRKLRFEERLDLLMALERNAATKLVRPNSATLVSTRYAKQVALLISHSDSLGNVEIIRKVLKENRVWGVILEDGVISLAGIAARQPEIGVIVNVLTHQDFRRKGYGSLVTSAATEDILRRSKICSLYVDEGNHEAQRVYERLGYRTAGRSVRFKISVEK
jgi:predicted GNAT family acetyltransferase